MIHPMKWHLPKIAVFRILAVLPLCGLLVERGLAGEVLWKLDFESEIPGMWDLPDANPLFNKANQEVALEILPEGSGPKDGGQILSITGPLRGFRNIRDMGATFHSGRISFDFALLSGQFNFFVLESPSTPQDETSNLRFSVNSHGRIYTLAEGGKQVFHGKIQSGNWYRVTLNVRLHEGGGGFYGFELTDLETGDVVVLEGNRNLPIDKRVDGLNGVDVDLAGAGSDLLFDNLVCEEIDDLTP